MLADVIVDNNLFPPYVACSDDLHSSELHLKFKIDTIMLLWPLSLKTVGKCSNFYWFILLLLSDWLKDLFENHDKIIWFPAL